LTGSGDVTFAGASWMSSPGANDKVARFRAAGDELTVAIPNSVIQPGTGVSPRTIDARIYPRAYKGNAQNVLALRQEYNRQWTVYYEEGQSPDAPKFTAHDTDVLTRDEWNMYMTPNAWHNLRITYKAVSGTPTTTVYIDGVFTKSMSTPQPNVYGNDWILTIGNFDGDTDEVRISSVDRGPLP